MIKFSKNGKRLGRPPKNKDSSGTVFIINEPKPVELPKELMSEELRKPEFGEIECSFVKIPQYSHVKSDDYRDGRYSASPANVRGLGSKQWVILAYLKTDFQMLKEQKKTDEEIIQGCLNYLNNPEERKKYQKKEPTPKYGYLTLVSKEIKFIEKNGEKVAVVELATNERTNENFWGEGERM